MSRLERLASKLNQTKGNSPCYTDLFGPVYRIGANLCTDAGFPLHCAACAFTRVEVTQQWFNHLFGEDNAPKIKID